MCGRYYRRSDKQRIAEAFHLGELPADFVLDPANYNIAPTTFQPVIRESRDDGSRELVLMRWGLIPFFAESIKEYKGISTINARAESITTSATWRAPFRSRRCLIPADGFYEWKKLPGAPVTKDKQPFAITVRDREPFAFAGLWDAWKEPKKFPNDVDTWLQSFSIITTDANELISSSHIHNRMPVILEPRDYDRWLSREISDQPPIDLLRPFPSDEMQLSACNQAVGNVRNNGPELLDAPLNSA